MKKTVYFFLLGLLLVSCQPEKNDAPYLYSVSETLWEESFGNHRAVLEINSPCEAAHLSFEWRRPDKDVANRLFLIVHAETGDTITNILRENVDNDHCELLFGPIEKAGTYHFYYLPYQVQTGYGNYYKDYLPQEKKPDAAWKKEIKELRTTREAKIVRVESRTAFDSFYPMEVSATREEAELYCQSDNRPYWIFAEDRTYPVRMKHNIPYRWLGSPKENISFKGQAMRNEYYAFQLAVWSASRKVSDVQYTTTGLFNGKHVIPAEAVTCFNIEGVDPDGRSFTKRIDLEPDRVQPLWFGVDIAEEQPAGTYKGIVEITDEGGYKTPVAVEIVVENKLLADRGDNEPWRHSRLRWLNSTLGISNEPTIGYQNLKINKQDISCLGRTVGIGENTPLPQSMDSWGNDFLSSPICFVIQTAEGNKKIELTLESAEDSGGTYQSKWSGKDDDLVLTCDMRMEFDGWLNYVYTIEPVRPLDIKDIRLEIPVKKELATYFMGMGLPGQFTPAAYSGKWDTPEKTVNNYGVSIPVSKSSEWLWPFDSFWCGTTHAGIHCELRGTTYSGPLLNLYRPAYPESWHNEGRGGFKIETKPDHTKLIVYSGGRALKEKENLSFDFSLLITPVKEINYKSQFVDRYYHNGGAPEPTKEDEEARIRIVNVHHANYLNPFINYPFLTTDAMGDFIHKWHDKNCRVKIYYTIRELTNVATEIWALRSLGNEILADGKGGGFPWCREHFVDGYTPQWYQHLDDQGYGIAADASILTATGESRWYNYYIEGLAWLVQHMDIDGIYMDDVSFDRRILKRMRRAMDGVKPGCVIDLHSNTGFSKGPAIQYAEYFPYVDKLWFGESFMYDRMSPANWLVEVSGIPFGLMGDMLHGGGNRWLGMQYGMTVRHPWVTEGVTCDPRIIWGIWDEFGIEDARMVGFWEKNPPVRSADPDVKVTSYIKDGQTLLSIGNYATISKTIRLQIDWEALGLKPEQVQIEAPEMADFQEKRTFHVGEPVTIEPKQGWILIMKQGEK